MFKKYTYILVLWMLAISAWASSSNQVVLRFGSMYAVDGPFITPEGHADPNIRGIVGDYQPWIVKSVKGHLSANGSLVIQVRGLVFPNAPNDEDHFRALVSCLTTDGTRYASMITQNVITAPFSTGPKGNANIMAHVSLPTPCVAPIVMILNGNADEGNVWFAVTGF